MEITNKRPLLSICIPTYNRARFLRNNLDKLVVLKGFDQDVEIVISDNASTDDTRQVVEEFSARYTNIKYFRNTENIRDRNFPMAIERARGEYVKLQNDNVLFTDDSLSYLKKCVREYKINKKPLFFTNDFIPGKKGCTTIECHSFDEYVRYAALWVTSISCFGVWQEQWHFVKDVLRYSEMMLSQEDWVFQLLEKFGECIICDERYFEYVDVGHRASYNWFHVHMENYYRIMQPYVEKGLISDQTLKSEKISYLKRYKSFIINIYAYPKGIRTEFHKSYDFAGTTRLFWKYFKKVPALYFIIFFYPIWAPYYFLKRVVKLTLFNTVS